MKPGEFLEKKRVEEGMSLRQVGYKCGLSHTYIRDIELGVLQGTPETHEKIVKALGMKPKEREKFFALVNEEKPLPVFVQDKIKKLEEKIEQLELEKETPSEEEDSVDFAESFQLNEEEAFEYNKILNMTVLMFSDDDFTEEARELLEESLKKVFARKLEEKRRKEGR